MKINVEGKKGKERPKDRWLDTIEIDMKAVGLCVVGVETRDKWKFTTKVIDIK